MLDDVPTVSTYHAYAGRLVREHGAAARDRGREPAAHRGRGLAGRRTRRSRRWDGPMDGVEQGRVDRDRPPWSTSPARWPSTSSAPTTSRGTSTRSWPRSSALPERGHASGATCPPRSATPSPCCASGARCCRSSSATSSSSAAATPWTSPTRWPWPRASPRTVAAGRRGRAAAVPGRAARRVPGHLRGPAALLRSLFVAPGAPVPVTAVGDPNQSIYGWRGRQRDHAAPLPRATSPTPSRPLVLPLSTSWRNDRAILDVANLRGRAAARGRPGCRSRSLRRTRRRRAAGTSPRPGSRRSRTRPPTSPPGSQHRRLPGPGRRTAAVLCRKRSQFDPVVEALEARGIPVEVVGLGGLLHTPEVADLVALLWSCRTPPGATS